MTGRFRALYGAGPLHLLALLASFAIAAAAVIGWFQRPRDLVNVLEWFAAAIVIHDLVLLPLYTLLDRIAFGRLPKQADRARQTALPRIVSPTPYLRIPAILSGLLLAIFFPVILGLGEQTEFSASGIAESGYLARWLLATGVMFAASGVTYAVTVARAAASPESHDPEPEHAPPDDTPPASTPDQAPPSDDPAPDQTPPSHNTAPAPAPDQTPPSHDAAPAPAPDQTPPSHDAAPAPAPDQTPPNDGPAPPPEAEPG